MPKHELMKSLEKEGFGLNYPDSLTIEEKIIEILKEQEERLYLALPLLLEKDFDYTSIKKELLKLKEGNKLLENFNKIILISKGIFKRTKRNYEYIEKIISENKIKSNLNKKELEYYLGEYQESKRTVEKNSMGRDDLEKIKKIESYKAREIIFSPAKIRIMRKIYEFKELTPTEKAYYYRDIKPLIDSLLNRNLQEYLEVVRKNRGKR